MMNVALLDHEGLVTREERFMNSPAGAEEISLGKKVAALRELACALLKEVEQLEESLSRQTASNGADLHAEVQRFEAEVIRGALKKTGGHQRRAARLLGVKVSTLNAKIKRYGIQPEEVVGLRLIELARDRDEPNLRASV